MRRLAAFCRGKETPSLFNSHTFYVFTKKIQKIENDSITFRIMFMEKYNKNSDTSYALGTTLTFELLKRKANQAKRIYISPKQKRDATYESIVAMARKNQIPVIENNEKIFRQLSEKDNCMVIGEFQKWNSSLSENEDHIVLVNPSNKGNLGTILRSAAAFSIRGIAIISPAADAFDPKTVRSSMGAIFSVPFRYYDSFGTYQKEMGERNYYPFMLQAKEFLGNETILKPYSLIFGNEATGLDSSFLKVGTPLKIPQSSDVDSLNLDNAVSIGLYEFSKK